MTSEQLLNMSIKVTSQKLLYLPKTNFWLRPWYAVSKYLQMTNYINPSKQYNRLQIIGDLEGFLYYAGALGWSAAITLSKSQHSLAEHAKI